MELLNAVARQLLLFAHALAFAFAIVTVIRQDVTLLMVRRIDAAKLKSTGHRIALLLGLLWITGASLIALDATDLRTLIAAPKMATKLVVVLTYAKRCAPTLGRISFDDTTAGTAALRSNHLRSLRVN